MKAIHDSIWHTLRKLVIVAKPEYEAQPIAIHLCEYLSFHMIANGTESVEIYVVMHDVIERKGLQSSDEGWRLFRTEIDEYFKSCVEVSVNLR
jgi:hypothetical protein